MGAYAKVHERGESGGVDQGGRASTIAGFAPRTAGPRNANGEPTAKDEYDILFATDVLAEGMNLQQAGQMINYDLPWNPMRIVQRPRPRRPHRVPARLRPPWTVLSQ